METQQLNPDLFEIEETPAQETNTRNFNISNRVESSFPARNITKIESLLRVSSDCYYSVDFKIHCDAGIIAASFASRRGELKYLGKAEGFPPAYLAMKNDFRQFQESCVESFTTVEELDDFDFSANRLVISKQRNAHGNYCNVHNAGAALAAINIGHSNEGYIMRLIIGTEIREFMKFDKGLARTGAIAGHILTR